MGGRQRTTLFMNVGESKSERQIQETGKKGKKEKEAAKGKKK